jgi:putative tryptophan/tyrosine transport system substrate-binding protein
VIDRRAFIGILAGGLLAAPLAAEGQRTTKIPRIGVLAPGSSAAPAPNIFGAFLRELGELGWVEGQNVIIELRFAGNRFERFPSLATELVRLRVDVILAAGGPASLKAAREATTTIPIVMVASSRDPVADGLAKSFPRPGGNITGLTTAPEEIGGKQLELLREADPGVSRVGILWDATVGAFRVSKSVEAVSRSLKIELVPLEVHAPADFEAAVAAATRERVNGLVVAGTPMFTRHSKQLADLLSKNRLRGISIWSVFPEAGGFMAYGPSLADEFRRAAIYVDKILKGANPGDLPIEQPTKYTLVINLKTARALGLTIPASLLQRADQVIE